MFSTMYLGQLCINFLGSCESLMHVKSERLFVDFHLCTKMKRNKKL